MSAQEFARRALARVAEGVGAASAALERLDPVVQRAVDFEPSDKARNTARVAVGAGVVVLLAPEIVAAFVPVAIVGIVGATAVKLAEMEHQTRRRSRRGRARR